MIDIPGRRRSHAVATPRGGGIGIVLAVLLGCAWIGLTTAEPARILGAFAIGLAMVAAAGWIDDHRGVSAWIRLAVHIGAATVMVSQLPATAFASGDVAHAMQFVVAVLMLVTAINFFNFMDGINGLLVTQSAWIAICAALLLALAGVEPWAWLAIVLGGACLGFLPFNSPNARIFLGDVGSGSLGFACGSLLLLVITHGALPAAGAVLVASALLIDAGLTLASRMLRGRRWYTAHREHLYQWLVRSGLTHARTTAYYLGWNLLLVLPTLWISHRRPSLAAPLSLLVAAAGCVLWCVAKRRLPKRALRGDPG